MDIELVKMALHFSKKKGKWLIIMGLIGFSSYGVYKVYNLPSLVRRRRRFLKLLGALFSVAEMVSESSYTFNIIFKDLKEFLQSDSDEIPKSLKQLSKITRSDEFFVSFSKVSEAITTGVLRAYYKSENRRNEIEQVARSSFSERVLDKLMSSGGTGFVSVVVGSFARNLIMGVYENHGMSQSYVSSSSSKSMDGLINVFCNEKFKVVIADCIRTFVSTAVDVYLDKTMSINFYDELFSGLTNPKYQSQVEDTLVLLCNGAVETFVNTSHQVLTSSKYDSRLNSDSSGSTFDQNEGFSPKSNELLDQKAALSKIQEVRGPMDFQNSGWVSSVSSTLAVPSNRKFLLDVTSRVTFETIRSLVEFFFWKISEALKRSFAVIREDVIDRGLEVIRYVGAKSSVILTLCLALFLHVLGSGRVLLPA
ncbi:hypothetical protein ACH5RR_027085 [Cinchona calisaya]|uniref:Protein PHLOEM PROTEIN 2-LIKE A10 n=1 Tax=Cinchona calisaya TaxID=153742 RepID=A0ABD2Z9F1_9GENT